MTSPVYFSGNDLPREIAPPEKLGLRGRRTLELARLGLPILPCVLVDGDLLSRCHEDDLLPMIVPLMENFERALGRAYGDGSNPLLLKLVISPNLATVSYPTLHGFGLTEATARGFAETMGEEFLHQRILALFRGMLEIEIRIADIEGRDADSRAMRERIRRAERIAVGKGIVDSFLPVLPEGFYEDTDRQMALTIGRIRRLLVLDEGNDLDTALMIQPLAFGNRDRDSCHGRFLTRRADTGEARLHGTFFPGSYDGQGSAGSDIGRIAPPRARELHRIATAVENGLQRICAVTFTVECGRVWIHDIQEADPEPGAAVRFLTDLHARGVLDDREVIHELTPAMLRALLLPRIDPRAASGIAKTTGGVGGAPGAAYGRVYFSSKALLSARNDALRRQEEGRFILCLASCAASDVDALQAASGILTRDGGGSAHASVVARQYGKVSVVLPDMELADRRARIGGRTVREGDILTMEAVPGSLPSVYFGKVPLLAPEPDDSGMQEILKVCERHLDGFRVLANAETPMDAETAVRFGAQGIGLCRTEHMFLEERRLRVLQEAILADDGTERDRALDRLRKVQKEDFLRLFRILGGRPLTIRLLDAPLHEFLPRSAGDLKALCRGTAAFGELQRRVEAMREFNPMLGRRGCRIAICRTGIYEAQVKAAVEAAVESERKGIPARPRIMIPMVMSDAELKAVVYGKRIEGAEIRGLATVAIETARSLGAGTVDCLFGAMIELPSAALGADRIALYADFFSFGTNDLTQTACGLSRDDFHGFLPDYARFDLLDGNPFEVLTPPVKELVRLAVERGRTVRPDLEFGMCGEHAAMEDNLRFCIEAGLDYVSCSPYAIPIVKLAAAKAALENAP